MPVMMNGPKKRDPNGLLPDWLMQNLVEPLAYGLDQGLNDLAGDNGVLSPYIGQQWETSPHLPKPEGIIPEIVSELPRTGIDSGGLAFAGTIPRMMIGGALAGYNRNPEEYMITDHKGQPMEESTRRLAAVGGAVFTGIVGGVPYIAGKVVSKSMWNAWVQYIKKAHPEEYARIQKYTGWSGGMTDGVEGEATDQAAQRVGQYRQATTHRGQEADFDGFANMKEGDIWEPNRVFSTSEDPAVAGWFKSSTGSAGVEGPPLTMTFRLKNGRKIEHVSHYQGEEEVLTPKGAKFRITKIHRRPDGSVKSVELEELGPKEHPYTRAENAEEAIREGSRGLGRYSSSQGEEWEPTQLPAPKTRKVKRK